MEVSSEVRTFIERYIDSIDRLEILTLLQRTEGQAWTASSVASALRIGASFAARQLAKLCSFSLLDVRIADDLYYSYKPRLPHLDEGARALTRTYESQPAEVARLIVARPPEPVREFAEAFRLAKKKGEPDG